MRAPVQQIAVGVALLAVSAVALGAESSQEARIKAQLLYHFLENTQWPGPTGPTNESPFRLLLVGEGLEEIEASLASLPRLSNGSRIVVEKRAKIPDPNPQAFAGVHLVFIGNKFDSSRAKAILNQLTNTHVLTVGEREAFVTKTGGMVSLFVDESQKTVVVDLSEQRAQAAQLQFKPEFLDTIRKNRKRG